MRSVTRALAGATLTIVAAIGVVAPASAHGDHPEPRRAQSALAGDAGTGLLSSPNVTHLSTNPSQVGISGCFMRTAPVAEVASIGFDTMKTRSGFRSLFASSASRTAAARC